MRVRLHGLTPNCLQELDAPAVLAADLDPAAVAAVSGREVAAALAALDEAAAAGIVVTGAGWSFGHDLVRETARLELPTADRLAVHARMGSYLAAASSGARRRGARGCRAPPAGIAAARGRGTRPRRGPNGRPTAAWSQLAWEDAAAFYARALRASDLGAGASHRAGDCAGWPWPGCAAST